MQLSINNFS